jgi:hypothetical protein
MKKKEKREKIATPGFLAACRQVLGDDKPGTVLRAIRERDPRMYEVYALDVRSQNPKLWFVSAIDEIGTPRVWAFGDTEAEALKKAQLAATDYREKKQARREMVPRTEWTFHPYPPEE